MRIDPLSLVASLGLAFVAILIDSTVVSAALIGSALGVILFTDSTRAQNSLALAVFFWGMFTFFSQGNAWYRAQYSMPAIEREYVLMRAGTEAGVFLSAWAQTPVEDGGGGGSFTFLLSKSADELNVFPNNPVWTYRISMPNDTLLILSMILLEDNGSDPLFENANGDLGRQQYRMEITPGQVPDILLQN